nr:MAG TPA: hypothetical protein [Caudoviricetes sp.]
MREIGIIPKRASILSYEILFKIDSAILSPR